MPASRECWMSSEKALAVMAIIVIFLSISLISLVASFRSTLICFIINRRNFDFIKRKIQIWYKQSGQIMLKRFFIVILLIVYSCAYDFVCFVVDTPNKISAFFATKCSSIRNCRNIFSNCMVLKPIFFKFKPFLFSVILY